MPVTPTTVVTGDATITADSGVFRQSGSASQTLIVLGDGNSLSAATNDSNADTLEVYGNFNVLRAGSGADILNAYGEANTLIGGAGSGQMLYAAGNNALMVGGTGRNQSLTADGNDAVLIAQGSGSTLLANGNNALLVAGLNGSHSLTVNGNDAELIGGAGANTLTAFGNNNVLVVAGCDVYKIAGSAYSCGPTTIRTAAQYRQKADWVVDRQLDQVPEIEMPGEPSGCYSYYSSGCGSYSVSYLMQWSANYQNYDFDRCSRNAPQQSLYLEGNDGILIGGGDGANTITAMGNNNLLVAGDRGTQTLTLDGNDGTVIGGGDHGVLTVNGNGATMQAGDYGLQELTLNGNDGTMIGGGKHDILTANGNGNFLIAGVSGVHFLTVNGNDNRLVGGGGTNLLTANGNNDVIEAGWGTNYLVNTGFEGTYQVELGDGRTTIMNGMEGNGEANTLEFMAGIDSDELWFRRSGDDLRIDVMGTRQTVTVDDWFAAAHHELAAIRTADGGVLDNHEVDQLVQAMASFSAGHPGYDVGASHHVQAPNDAGLQGVLAAVWQA